MGYKCPKCGYERQPKDLAPEDECPKCGVIYEKYIQSKNKNFEAAEALFWKGEITAAEDLFKELYKRYPDIKDKFDEYIKKIGNEKSNRQNLEEAQEAIRKNKLSTAREKLKEISSVFVDTSSGKKVYLKEINEKLDFHDELLSEVMKATEEERYKDAKLLCEKIKSEFPQEDQVGKHIETLGKYIDVSSLKGDPPQQQTSKNLVKCHECGKAIGIEATMCRNCGVSVQGPPKKIESPVFNGKNLDGGISVFIWLLLLFGLLFFAFFIAHLFCSLLSTIIRHLLL